MSLLRKLNIAAIGHLLQTKWSIGYKSLVLRSNFTPHAECLDHTLQEHICIGPISRERKSETTVKALRPAVIISVTQVTEGNFYTLHIRTVGIVAKN